MRFRGAVICCVVMSFAGAVHSAALDVSPSDAEVRQILVKRIDTEKRGVGIVVGVIDRQGRRIIPHGSLEKRDP
jgi:serine-type D-Ala-D-Ala carboxypeptidase/endopeptidase